MCGGRTDVPLLIECVVGARLTHSFAVVPGESELIELTLLSKLKPLRVSQTWYVGRRRIDILWFQHAWLL